MYQPVTKWDDPGIDPLMKFGDTMRRQHLCCSPHLFTINDGDRRLFGVNLAEKSRQCPLINLLNHAFELVVQKVSLQFVRFGILGFVKCLFKKMSMKSEGQRKKCWISGTFSPVFEWGKLSSTMGPQWQNQALELFFFFPNLAEIDAMPPFFFDPMRSHSQRLDWPDIII